MLDLARAGAALLLAEVLRRALGPRAAVARARQLGRRTPSRDAAGRAELARAIARIDRRLPGGGNCYRRVLAEVCLDRGAASEPIRFGLAEGAAPGSGHVWFEGRPDALSTRPFALTFTL